MNIKHVFWQLLFVISAISSFAEGTPVHSPDGRIALSFDVKKGRAVYSVSYKGRPALEESLLGVELQNHAVFTSGKLSVSPARTDDVPLAWGNSRTLSGSFVRGTYRVTGPSAAMEIEFFLHGDGVAFRYFFPRESLPKAVKRESTSFRFPAGSAAWAIPATESLYPLDPIPLEKILGTRMFPLSVRIPNGLYACLLEADVRAYPRSIAEGDGKGGLGVRLLGKVPDKAIAWHSPWRVIVLAESAAELAERQDFILRLNPPCTGDVRWVKPGLTVSNEGNCSLRMADVKRLVDFAAWIGARYVQLDWGWYGTEWTWTEQERKTFRTIRPDLAARTDWVTNTYANPYRPAVGLVPYRPDWKQGATEVNLNLPDLVAYAKARGIGICLYLHGRVMEAQRLDELFATYEKWGLAGLKPGFVRYGDTPSTEWLREMIAAAARHHLWLDIHDSYIPDGIQRTFPHMMISEGGGGQENRTYPTHQELSHPFTRCLAGPQDFTPYFYKRGSSHMHAAAMLAVLPGPTAVLRGGLSAWKAKSPAGFGEEVEFIRSLPMNWDDTRVLDGAVGRNIIVARRAKDTWFLAGMTGETGKFARNFALTFLSPGVRYTATLFCDADNEQDGHRAVVKETRSVTAQDTLKISMAVNGGFAAIFRPVAQQTDFFVSPSGDDAAQGTADAPFATLERAKQAAKEFVRRVPGVNRPIVVELRDGLYELSETLTFGPGDSFPDSSPLVFRAAKGASPVVSAGRVLHGWRVGKDGRWRTQIPEAANNGRFFSQLYVNNQRRLRPILPKKGYYYIADEVPPKTGKLPDRFLCKEGDFNPDWTVPQEIEVCLFHNWSMSRIPLASFHPETREVRLAGTTWHSVMGALTSRTWYRLENVADALSEPGEWYLDRKSGSLTYLPMPGETPETAVVVAPWLDVAVRVEGTKEKPVANLAFQGITFAFNRWNVPTNGYSYAQAEALVPGMLTACFARNVRVEGGVIRNTGTYAVDFGAGCRDCVAGDIEMYDMGAGGVKIGVAWEGEKDLDANTASGCRAEENLIVHGGRVHPAAVGVWIGHANRSLVSHNTIHDFYYSGISCGWSWGYYSNHEFENIIEWNDISKIGQRVLSDMGGIYTLGLQPGGVERFNRIHDLRRARYGSWGIYFDSGSSFLSVSNNVIYDCEDGGWFMAAISKTNRVENNIFAFGVKQQILPLGTDPSAGNSFFQRNIVFWREGDIFLLKPLPLIEFSSNLYWRTESPASISFASGGFEKWRVRDPGSRVEEPRFTQSTSGDFSLVSGSPMPSGFVPFSLDRCGRTSPDRRSANLPRPPAVYFPAPPEPELNLTEDFERIPVGGMWRYWELHDSEKKSSVCVTDERAAGGKHALVVTDASSGYEPHLCSYPCRKEGRVTVSFDLWIGVGAMPSFELRDYDPSYSTGPIFHIRSDGTLCGAGGKRLMTLPHETWCHMELSTLVGSRRDGLYSISVTTPQQSSPRVFEGLHNTPGFKTLGWIGFCSNASHGEVYRIDNFKLSPL